MESYINNNKRKSNSQLSCIIIKFKCTHKHIHTYAHACTHTNTQKRQVVKHDKKKEKTNRDFSDCTVRESTNANVQLYTEVKGFFSCLPY